MAKKKPKPPWLRWFLDRREFLRWLSNIAGLAVSIWGYLKPTPPVQATVQAQPAATLVASCESEKSPVLLTKAGVLTITGSASVKFRTGPA
jgi:hypothetical protein